MGRRPLFRNTQQGISSGRVELAIRGLISTFVHLRTRALARFRGRMIIIRLISELCLGLKYLIMAFF